jgi:hypothetical protein
MYDLALICLETLCSRRANSSVVIILDLFFGRVNSPGLLFLVNVNIPR